MKKILSLILCAAMLVTACALFASCGGAYDVKTDGKAIAYILTEVGDTYSTGLGGNFKTAFVAAGGEVVEESFPANTTDFTAYLQKAMDSHADVIFTPNSTTVAANLIKQADDKGITIPMLAGDTWESSVILDAVKNTDLDVYCSTFFDESDTSSTSAASFVTGFKAWLNADNTRKTNNGGNDIVAAVSALGYDSYNVAYEAVKAALTAKGAATTSVDVATALWAIDITNAVTGSVKFDQNGDAIKDTAYIKYAKQDGAAFQFVKTQSATSAQTQGSAVTYDKTGIAIDGTTVRIGVYEPQSGANGAGGKQEVLGIQYANSLKPTIEVGGVTYTVELTIVDNESSETTGVTAAANLAATSGMMCVLGSYGSGVSMAAAATFENAGLPAIGVSCTNSGVTLNHNYYFRICFLDPFQGSVMANFAKGLIGDAAKAK